MRVVLLVDNGPSMIFPRSQEFLAGRRNYRAIFFLAMYVYLTESGRSYVYMETALLAKVTTSCFFGK